MNLGLNCYLLLLALEHPISTELDRIVDIFTRMGFDARVASIDDDWNMFGALNFPEGTRRVMVTTRSVPKKVLYRPHIPVPCKTV